MLFANEHAHANDAEYNAAVCNRTRPDAQVPNGTYREHRRGLVMWIANKANRFTLKTLTIHYATNYLDRCVLSIFVCDFWNKRGHDDGARPLVRSCLNTRS